MWDIYFYFSGGRTRKLIETNYEQKNEHKIITHSPSYRSYDKKQIVQWEQENLGDLLHFHSGLCFSI